MKIAELLQEISPIPDLKTIESDWEDHLPNWIENWAEFIKDMPKINGYEVKLYKKKYTTNSCSLIAFDDGKPIALLSQRSEDTDHPFPQIIAAKVKPGYRGQKIGLKLYLMMIKYVNPIMSDYEQTSSGQKVWENLFLSGQVDISKFEPYSSIDKNYVFTPIHNLKELKNVYHSHDILVAKKK